MMVSRKDVLLIAGFLLLLAFITHFFLIMADPGYWHFMDIGAYLSRTFFAIEHGFFVEVPYWNYGYGYVTFAVYPPLFSAVNVALFHALSLVGIPSIYWSFFVTFLLSYAFALIATWKISKRAGLVYLLTVGNFFSVGFVVLMGFYTKLFAFNLCFPAIVYLLERRHNLELGRREVAAFAVLLSVLFASQLYIFAVFTIFYLSMLLQNRKALLPGLVPFAFVPILTLPYFSRLVSFIVSRLGTSAMHASMTGGLAFNYYTAIFVLFVLLFLVVRELWMAPLAAIAALCALNLNAAVPILAKVEMHAFSIFFLAIICYYLVTYDFSKQLGMQPRLPSWLSREKALFALLFVLLVLNFPYFAPRFEQVNLFNNAEYGPLLEFGELESVFFVADLDGRERYVMPYVSYQTFKYHNYSVNDWFPVGEAFEAFDRDRKVLVEALGQNDCGEVERMVEKMQLRTLALKNLPAGFSCNLEMVADLGAFKVLRAE